MLGKDVQEIAVKPIEKNIYDPDWKYDWDAANKIIQSLVEQNYVVMVSTEERLIIIDYVYDDRLIGDRNGVAFMSSWELEDRYYEKCLDEECDCECGCEDC